MIQRCYKGGLIPLGRPDLSSHAAPCIWQRRMTARLQGSERTSVAESMPLGGVLYPFILHQTCLQGSCGGLQGGGRRFCRRGCGLCRLCRGLRGRLWCSLCWLSCLLGPAAGLLVKCCVAAWVTAVALHRCHAVQQTACLLDQIRPDQTSFHWGMGQYLCSALTAASASGAPAATAATEEAAGCSGSAVFSDTAAAGF